MDAECLFVSPLVRPPDSMSQFQTWSHKHSRLKSGGLKIKQILVKMVRGFVREERAGRERRKMKKK